MKKLLEKIFGSNGWFFEIDSKITMPFLGRDIDSVQGYILEVLKTLIGFGGLVAVAFIVYGAYLFILASGDPETIEKAQRVITNAIIGLILASVSFMIVNYIINLVS